MENICLSLLFTIFTKNYGFPKILQKRARNCFLMKEFLSARLYNPSRFLSVTMIGDGHDTRINFGSLHNVIGLKIKKYYSWKLKKQGFRYQFTVRTLSNVPPTL